MPAKVFDKLRANVTAGLAKLVDEVKKYAPPMYAATANGAADARPERTTPKMTSRRPMVATTSLTHRPAPLRAWVDNSTAGNENITLATTAPTTPPSTWATQYTEASAVLRPPNTRSARVTTGFRWAPDTGPRARMMATSAPAVATAFSNSCRPTSRESVDAAMPDPTTAMTSNAVPTASATARRASPEWALGCDRGVSCDRFRNVYESQR